MVAQLGQGGMALIHLAVVVGVGGARKLVVLKSMRPEFAADAHMREMFLTEARLAVTLAHPNIVQTFEVVILEGRPVLVMEYLDGQPLSSILRGDRRQAVPLSAQLYVLKEVLDGLDYVHNLADLDGTPLNLVHRDISPPNVFVTYDGHAKILDFGIAKNVRSAGNTETGVIKGKVRYMAPEQFRGSAKLDRRTDIFAVGVLLWEAIAGKRLWEGMPDVQIMRKLLDGDIPMPRAAGGTVPRSLRAICSKAMAHRCEDRYESAAAMQADLEAAIDELDVDTNARQVGKLVGELFRECRAQTKDMLEHQLRDDELTRISFVDSEESETESVVNSGLGLGPEAPELPEAPGLTEERSIGPALSPPARSSRRLKIASAAVAAAVALGVSIASTLTRSRHEGSATAPATTDRVAGLAPAAMLPLAAPSETRDSVHVTIRATPARARIYLDDVLLGANPFDGDVRREPGQHLVRGEARGYRSRTIAVSLTAPLTVNIDLEAASAGSPPARPTPGRTVAPSGTASDAVSGFCKPPFYFDPKGIKLYKPECL